MNKSDSGNSVEGSGVKENSGVRESRGAIKVKRGLTLLCFLKCLAFNVMLLTEANFDELLIILLLN